MGGGVGGSGAAGGTGRPGRGTEAPAGEAGHEWLRGYLGWDCYYLFAYAGTIAFVLNLDDRTAGSRPLASVLLACCGLWYAVHGRAYVREDEAGRRGLLHLGVLFVLFTGAVTMASAASLSLVAVVPQVYWALPPLSATGVMTLFALVPVGAEMLRTGVVTDSLTVQGPTALAVILFSAAFGTWVHRIIDQSRERAVLIQQLAATRAELAEAAGQAGAAAERERLAGEIHDAIAQGLSSIVMLSQAATTTLDRMTALPPGHRASLDRARHQLGLVTDTARENLAEAGALVAALRPTALDDSSLPQALRRLTDRAAEGAGPAVGFAVRGAPEPLPVAVEVVLLRSAQEALANALRHAKATAVHVTLEYGRECVAVRVSDDGVGFDPRIPRGGYGLSGIIRRVEQLGGKRQLSSAPGEGTTLAVEVPR